MIKRIFFLNLLLISVCSAQEVKVVSKKSSVQTPPSPGINFDILHYRIDLDWVNLLNNNDLQYSGSTTIWIVPDDTLSFVRLQYGSMNLESAAVNNLAALLAFEPDGMFTINTGKIFTATDTVKIKINFVHQNTNQLGLYFFVPSASVLIPEKIAYTMSEPFEGKNWYPCYNYPDEKAMVETHTRVPSGYTVSSNGLLQTITENGDNTRTFFWKSKDEMASYLAVVNASKFDTYTQYYKKVTSPLDSIPILNFFWAEDRNGNPYNAINALKYLPQMMTVYSTLFGEYPFEKYGHTVASPFYYGGMEHQSLTTANRSWLKGNDDGFAHELTHQWFGDLITCKTFKDIWMNEGFATYGETLWNEAKYGKEERIQISEGDRSGYFKGKNTIPVYDPPEEMIFNYATTYAKGGWILHMFRKQIGDDLFFGLLKYYVIHYRNKSVSSQEFISICNTFLNTDYSWFFNQWLFIAGHPKIDVKWEYSSSGKSVTAKINQQSSSGTDYRFLLDLKLRNSEKDTLVTIEVSKKSEEFIIPVNFPVNSMLIDPEVWTLAEIGSVSNNLNGNTEPEDFSVSANYPNPFNGGTHFILQNNRSGKVRFEVFDISGKRISDMVIESGVSNFSWNPPSNYATVSSAIYLYRFSGKTISKTGKMLYLK